MALLAQLVFVLLSLSVSYVCSVRLHFVPPDAILQARFPAGFRAYIPDFPGCERFSFFAKLNSPFSGNEVEPWGKDVLQPQFGYWTFDDPNAVLAPGDVLHYWTLVVKDKVPYPKKNLTWTVPDPNNAVDFLTTSATKASSPKPTHMKVMEPEDKIAENEEPTDDEDSRPTFPEIEATVQELPEANSSPALTPPATTNAITTEDSTTSDSTTEDATSIASSPGSLPTSTKVTSTAEPTTTAASLTTSPQKTSPTATVPSTESPTTAGPTATVPSTESPTTDVPTTSGPLKASQTTAKPASLTKSPVSEQTKQIKKSTPPMANPLVAEDVEELTTPAFPFEKPLMSEFPEEPPLFPFPSLFPRPRPPIPPPAAPGLEACSNPWNFEELPGETRTQRLERQVAKLQCQLALSQRGTAQLGNRVETELNDMKKLIYGMVSRMSRLENLLRTAAFG